MIDTRVLGLRFNFVSKLTSPSILLKTSQLMSNHGQLLSLLWLTTFGWKHTRGVWKANFKLGTTADDEPYFLKLIVWSTFQQSSRKNKSSVSHSIMTLQLNSWIIHGTWTVPKALIQQNLCFMRISNARKWMFNYQHSQCNEKSSLTGCKKVKFRH